MYVGYNIKFEEAIAVKEFFMKGITERNETTCVVSVSNADNVTKFVQQQLANRSALIFIRLSRY